MKKTPHNLLLDTIAEHYSLDEIRTLCFDLDVDYDHLGGEGKEGKARELMLYLQRRGRLKALVDAVVRQRSFTAADLANIDLKALYVPEPGFPGWWMRFRQASLSFQLLVGISVVLLIIGIGAGSIWSLLFDVRPAFGDERLIMVAGFEGPGDLSPDLNIFYELETLVSLDAADDVEVKWVQFPKRLIYSHETAREWGNLHRATIVVWGRYDADQVEAHIIPMQTFDIPSTSATQKVLTADVTSAYQRVVILPKKIRIMTIIALGIVEYSKENMDGANSLWIQAIDEAMQLDPKTQQDLQLDDVHVGLGNTYESMNDLESAQTHYEIAEQINPTNQTAIYDNAVVSYKLGDYEKAIRETRKIIDAEQPDDPDSRGRVLDALILAIMIEVDSHNLDQALKLARKAITVAPDDARSHNMLSYVYAERREWDHTLTEATRAIELDPEDPSPYFNLGRAYLHLGRFDEARATYQKAIDLTASSPDDAAYFLPAAKDELMRDREDSPELANEIDAIIELLDAAIEASTEVIPLTLITIACASPIPIACQH